MNDNRDPNDPLNDDWLDQALRQHAGNDDYIGDDGFTARVMDALPAPVTLPAWRRPALTALWGMAALGAAVALPQMLPDLTHDVLHLLAAQPISLSQIGTAILALAAASWA